MNRQRLRALTGGIRATAWIALAVILTAATSTGQILPQTGAEMAGWERHTNHEELATFLFEVQALTDKMLVRELTTTDEGRTVFLVVLGDPPAATPGTAWLSGKPTVLIVNNVHGGEMSGREGGLLLIRELAIGSLQPLLEQVNVLVVPSINPDGANREPRASRGNSHGYDMNRDYVVMETPEIAALVEDVLLEWWPDVHIDGHNGGSRPYNLTYQATLHPAADSDLVALANGPMYEAVKAHMEDQGLLFHWYSGPRQDQDTGEWTWTTSDPLLRKQHSYSGFQNMIALLFECPGGTLDLQARSQFEGEVGLLKYVADNAELVRRTVMQARRRTAEGAADEVVISWQQSTYPGTAEFYVTPRDPETGARGEATLVTGTRSTLFIPAESRKRPWAYAFNGRHHNVAELLRRHAVEVERLQEPITLTVEAYQPTAATWDERPYQNHHLAHVEVEVVEQEVTLEAGTYLVRTAQNGGTLAAYLLEPDTDDSAVTWNFLDPFIRAPRQMPAGAGGGGQMPARAGAGGQMPPGAGQGGRQGGGGGELPIYRIVDPVGVKAVILP
jgi:hypothetical protein